MPASSNRTTQVVPGMLNVYQQLLGLNTQNYQNVLSGFTQGQQNISSGYESLNSQVANTLGMGGHGWGVATPAAQAIQRTYAANQGRTQQRAINSGLGNTTVLANLANQDTMQATQAYGNLGAELARTYAGYQSQIGMARNAASTGLTQSYLGNLSNYQFRNTAGDLTGSFDRSQSFDGGGYGHGAGGGGMGGGMGSVGGLENMLGGLGGGHSSGGSGHLGYGQGAPMSYGGYGGYGGGFGGGMNGAYGSDQPGSETNPTRWQGLGDVGSELDPGMFG